MKKIFEDFNYQMQKSLKNLTKLSFNTANLPEKDELPEQDIRKGKVLDFNILNDIGHNSSIYWFSAKRNDIDNLLLPKLKDSQNYLNAKSRKIPPINEIYKDCLYVGIRKGGIRKKDKLSNLSGRIIIHLGYYNKGSQGLQLLHWAKNLNVNIELNILKLENNYNYSHLKAAEILLADELEPLFGRH